MTSVYLGQDRLLVSLPWGGLRMVVPASDMSLTPDLALSGSWDMPLTRFLLNSVKPGDFTVDAGAHVGYFSVILAALVGPAGQVHAFEPNPTVFPWLVENTALNYLTKHIRAHQQAVFSTAGTSPLHTYHRLTGSSTFRELSFPDYPLYQKTVVQVDQVRLDEHFQDVEKIDLLKMDIEGSEYQALLGMTRLIEERRIGTLVFEWNPDALQEDLEPFSELLRRWTVQGVTLSLLDPSGNPMSVPIDAILSTEEIIPHVVLNWI